MFRRLIFIIFCYILPVSSSFIKHVHPKDIYRNFAQEIDYGHMIIQTTPTNHSLVITTERIFNHERLPFAGSQSRCLLQTGKIVPLLEMREKYLVSCCTRLNLTFHSCPRIPMGESHMLFDLLLTEQRSLYYSLASGGEWEKDDTMVRYTYSNTMEAVVRIVLAICALSVALFCTLHFLVGTAHQFSNKYPQMSVVSHVTWTVLFTIFLMILLHDEENPLLQAGIFHTLLQTSFSLSLVYIPSDGINTVDQRISVASNTCCSKLATHPKIKYFAVHVFTSSLVCSTLSTYSIFCVLWDRFDAAFDILFLVTIAQILLMLVFYVAFLTAIYDIHSPLRMDSDMVVLQTKGISPYGKIFMFNPISNTFEETIALKPYAIIGCIARGSTIDCWEVGTMTKHGIQYDKRIVNNATSDTCGVKHYFEVPDKHKKTHRIPLYSVDKQKSLFKIGVLQKKEHIFEVHLYHTNLLKFFEFLLKIAPEIDDSGQGEYKINIVENVRSYTQQQCHKRFSKRPKMVSIAYWLGFACMFALNAYWLGFNIARSPSWWPFYLFECLVLCCMAVFATHVSTKRKFVLTRQNASRFSLKRSADDTAIKIIQGHESDMFQHENVFICPIANSTNPSICFVSVLNDAEQIISKTLWNAQCPNKHGLRCMKTKHPNWVCDQCEKSLQRNSTVWYCEECNWCQCHVCAPLFEVQHCGSSLNIRLGKKRTLSLCSIEYNGRWKVKISG